MPRKLARCYRAGDLTAVWVPDAAHEALRDLVRAREAAKKDQLKARHRLGKFLLRHGRRPEKTMKNWTGTHLAHPTNGIQTIHFDEYAQEQTLLDYRQEVEHQQARIRRLDLREGISFGVRTALECTHGSLRRASMRERNLEVTRLRFKLRVAA